MVELTLILLDRDREMAAKLAAILEPAGYCYSVRQATTAEQFRSTLAALHEPAAIVLSEIAGGSLGALAALEILQTQPNRIRLIVVTSGADDRTAAECFRRGAADYLRKSELGRLPEAISRG